MTERKLMLKILVWIQETVKLTGKKLSEFIQSLYRHLSAVIVLGLAGLGLNSVLSHLPFVWTLPMWIETPMVIPVLSVLGILLLTFTMEAQNKVNSIRV